MELAKAYVQIIPSAKGISGQIEQAIGGDVASAGTSAGKTFGSNLVGTITKVVAAAGIGIAIKKSLDAGGALQQSFGGLETIYGDAAEQAKEYAKEAAKSGISMNSYAEQAVSFGASLKQAYGDDIAGAVEAANVAILDMADNSAKMGTPLESIQNAYQGFAKQNYTMLDNLKLGYGGTKKEMERLLADAEKLSGVHYDMENLGDVYSAIHVIQQELGLTGVAAAEAEGTFTGSMGAMKASVENLFAALSTGGDITEPLMIMFTSVKTFLLNNVLPMIMNIVGSIPTLIKAAFQAVADTDWNEVVTNIITSFQSVLDSFSLENFSVDTSFIDGIMEGIKTGIPKLIDAVVPMITKFTEFIADHAGDVVNAGISIIKSVVEGIIKAMPTLIAEIPKIIINITNVINDNMPKILKAGLDIIIMLGKGIIQNIPVIIANMGNIVAAILGVINAVHWLDLGSKIIKLIGNGIKTLATHLPDIIRDIIRAIKELFTNFDWGGIGSAIISGIASGIRNAGSMIKDAAVGAAASAFQSAKEFLGIGSPSKLMRDEVGKWIPAGIAEGIEDNMSPLRTAIGDIAAETSGSYDMNMLTSSGGSVQSGETVNISGVTINVTAQDVQQSRDFVDWLEAQLVARQNSRRAAALA